jgi:FdhD protein
MTGDMRAAQTVPLEGTRIFFGESDVVRRPVVRWQGDAYEERPDTLAPEEPLEIRLAGRSLTVTMRTPGHDEELVAGLLYAQELVRSAADLGVMARDPAQPNRLDVRLSEAVDSDERWRRYTYASSSCGICGVESLEALVLNNPPVTAQLRVPARTLYGLDTRLRAAQAGFGATGGTHAAALFNPAGDLVVAREDVGRHNAVDKVIGYGLLRDLLPLDSFLLLVSGRISYEIVQKALVARLPMIAAVSAPTSLAVRVADERGITLVGFLRGEHMNVYSHPERVIGP